ncbi:hypothetical protein [Silvibacterium dinghuense]|uniref:Uncharacterized protein n=1 Tax=Silvibacterium dinghuense TaxID=1560006 RepID=A0A4Q1SJE0_9BACT|nr:hypothetical protein [Silvibacterium dinghuense]RXS97751.1 hypothetical protein ESZ00_07780 [Silvibacterium dinghuense]GGH01741.1 hypothetical protein GCM10011586_16760 [Silvibacterium dinghuense]
MDLSTQLPNSYSLQVATTLLRACGGAAATLLMPPATGDTTDAGQLGIDAPNFQSLVLTPSVFRKIRATMSEGQPAKYELLIAAAAIANATNTLQLASTDTLFAMAAGVVVDGKLYLIEATGVSENLGEAYLYRLLLRESTAEWPMQSGT